MSDILQNTKDYTLGLTIVSIVFTVVLMAYFFHTIISQYCKCFKPTKNFQLLKQPPFITPRRICHFGILCYILCQINFIAWEFYYYLHTLKYQDFFDLKFVYWYEFGNLFDILTFCSMFMTTLIALFVSLIIPNCIKLSQISFISDER